MGTRIEDDLAILQLQAILIDTRESATVNVAAAIQDELLAQHAAKEAIIRLNNNALCHLFTPKLVRVHSNTPGLYHPRV
jgi:hypothetical protein